MRPDDHDQLSLGPFLPNCQTTDTQKDAAITATYRFLETYNANGLVIAQLDLDFPATCWRKPIYNASFNPVPAILRMDVTWMRVYEHVIDELVRPAMVEGWLL